jgi:chromate transport protein ChrA
MVDWIAGLGRRVAVLGSHIRVHAGDPIRSTVSKQGAEAGILSSTEGVVIPGAVLALIAVTIPPLLLFPLDAAHHRLKQQRWIPVVMRSLNLFSVRFLLSTTWSILENHVRDGRSSMICLAACACCFTHRINSLPLLALAAALGYLLYR